MEVQGVSIDERIRRRIRDTVRAAAARRAMRLVNRGFSTRAAVMMAIQAELARRAMRYAELYSSIHGSPVFTALRRFTREEWGRYRDIEYLDLIVVRAWVRTIVEVGFKEAEPYLMNIARFISAVAARMDFNQLSDLISEDKYRRALCQFLSIGLRHAMMLEYALSGDSPFYVTILLNYIDAINNRVSKGELAKMLSGYVNYPSARIIRNTWGVGCFSEYAEVVNQIYEMAIEGQLPPPEVFNMFNLGTR